MSSNKLISLIILRSLLICIMIWTIDQIVNLDTSLFLVFPTAIIGITTGFNLAQKSFKFSALSILTICALIIYQLSFFIINYLAPSSNLYLFVTIFTHLDLLAVILLLTLWSAYLILKVRSYATAEVFLILITCLAFFALHQNYRFDLIKIVNDLAWQLKFPPLAIITGIGFAIISLLTSYLFLLGTLAIEKKDSLLVFNQILSEKRFQIFNAINLILLIGFFLLITYIVYNAHQGKYEIAVQNGVGSSNESGVSPLNFDSALGGSNQPAALVRLENDYLLNPHSPMIYLRESALSQLKKNELVLAGPEYDPDITRTSTYQTYVRKADLKNAADRQEIVQKVYLLGDHQLAFGLDYPKTIRPLRLQNKDHNFKGAFKVTSLAPNYGFEQIAELQLGDPDWDKKAWAHYTEKHPDLRYQELAEKLTSKAVDRLDIVLTIIDYLNHNAIYTLTPNHELSKEADPTAKFLFGDLRGYCVHFAHATVYLLRALGIPSRIGTGYLTDFSQAKDGHILLRMSDRHAWAEVYIDTIGWVPFDTQPEQVESHAETPVDQSLLDNLIDSLGTDEEIISDDLLDPELKESDRLEQFLSYIKLKQISFLILALVSLLYLRKLYLLLGWKLQANPENKLKRIYQALSIMLQDLGYPTKSGETKIDYLLRVKNTFPVIDQELAEVLNKIIYATKANPESGQLDSLLTSFYKSLRFKQKALVAFNPSSIFKFKQR